MKVVVIFVVLLLRQVYCTRNHHKGAAEQQACIVHLKSGLIRGDCGHAIYDAYKNIPYAKPPVGELRFESPQPMDKWPGVLNATGPLIACVQFYGSLTQTGVEDCLKITVYVPKKSRQPNDLRANLKVILWIYPGGFQFGAPFNDPSLVTQDGDTIFVAFAHRMGPLGFYSTGNEYISGNMGLKDQRLAMQWVVENIAAFGGDPRQIVVLGNSAGAAAVELHLLVNTIDAKAYAALSGTILSSWAFLENPQKSAEIYANTLKCPYDTHNNALKQCLKQRSVAEFLNASIALQTFLAFSPVIFRPTIEPECVRDAFLTKHPLQLLKAGSYPKKPYLVGTIRGEGVVASSFLSRNSEGKYFIEELNQRWQEVCPPLFYLFDNKPTKQHQSICNTLRERYMCNKPFSLETYKLLELMIGDEYVFNGVEEAVKLHQAAGQRVYRYFADLPTRYSVANVLAGFNLDLCFGSGHTNDANIILPDDLSLPPEPRATRQALTAKSLVALIKSLLNNKPKYKHLDLPVNGNASIPDQCLYFSFDNEHLGACRLEEVNCQRIESIVC